MGVIGDLFWKIKGDTSDIDKKLGKTDENISKTSGKFGKFQTLLKKAAPWIAAGAAAFALGKKILTLGINAGNAADKLLDLTEITGLNTDTLQELQFIAADSGVSFDGLTGAVQKFTAKIPDLEGTSNVADAFAALDVALRDSNGEVRDSNDLFPEMIKSLQNVQNTTERNAIAQQLFGRSLQDLAPVLGLTNDEFDNLRDKAEDAGAIIGGDALNAANDFRKGMDTAKLAVSQAKISLGSQFAPVLSEVVIPIVTTAANIINTLASAIGALNDLLIGSDNREDQIKTEIDFYQAQIEKVKTLTMLNQDQRDVMTSNYEASITQLNQELRGLALQAEAAKYATENKKEALDVTEEQTAAIDEEVAATEELISTGQNLIGEALVPMTQASMDMWRAYGEGIVDAKTDTEELAQMLIDFEAVTATFITSFASGFEGVGAALAAGEDAFTAFGKTALGSLAEVLRALGAQLAAQAAAAIATALLGGVYSIPAIAGATAGSAAAYTAAGAIDYAATQLADGGIVMPSPGGTIAQIAEAGQAEAVIPLDKLEKMLGGQNKATTLILNIDGKRVAQTSANYYNNGVVELNI